MPFLSYIKYDRFDVLIWIFQTVLKQTYWNKSKVFIFRVKRIIKIYVLWYVDICTFQGLNRLILAKIRFGSVLIYVRTGLNKMASNQKTHLGI